MVSYTESQKIVTFVHRGTFKLISNNYVGNRDCRNIPDDIRQVSVMFSARQSYIVSLHMAVHIAIAIVAMVIIEGIKNVML